MIMLDIFQQFPAEFPIFKTLLSGFVSFVLGLLWYHPKVMGERWVEALGRTEHHKSYGVIMYVVCFALWMLASCVYSFLAGFLTPPAIGELLGLSTFLWVGFTLPPIMIAGMVTGKNLIVMGIHSSYFLSGLYLFAVIHDVL